MGIHTFKIGENRGPTVKLKKVVSIFAYKDFNKAPLNNQGGK